MKKHYKSILNTALITLMLGFANLAFAGCYWWQDCTQYKTKYPIMLVHGFGGWDDIAGVDYFYTVPHKLEQRGATVFVANVSAANTPQYRGEQLILQMEDALAISGAQKMNLIGHSLGGPTIRYVAGVRPDLVASATSVSAMGMASKLADFIGDEVLPPGASTTPALTEIFNALTGLIDSLSGAPSGNQQDVTALYQSITTEALQDFNASYPDGMPTSWCGQGDELAPNGIYYYSWGGDRPLTNFFDVGDPLLGVVSSLVFDGEDNDGLVGTCEMHWGKFLGDYKMNHLDTINHLFGLHHLFDTDPVTLYKNHAIRLKSKGL